MQQLTAVGIGVVVFSLLGSPVAIASDDEKSNIFVSNRDSTMSLVRCKARDDDNSDDDSSDDHHSSLPGDAGIACEEVENENVGFSTSWPANQYEGEEDWWWSGLNGEVIGLKAEKKVKPLLKDKNRKVVDTYTYDGVPPGLPTAGSNFIGVSPKGKTAWNSAREIDEIQEIDIDPDSDTFGQILTHITVPLSPDAGPGSATRGKMRPCDMSITPNGKYLWEPDIGGETVTGVDIKGKQVIAQITLPREDPANRVIPFMLTTNGKMALVENFEAPFGTESIIDVTDPDNPVHVKKLTQADGLGVRPQTSEFTPDGKYAYIVANGTPSIPGEVNVLDLDTLQITKSIALPAGCRPHTGDFTNDGGYFVVNCSGSNTVAVISNKLQEVVQDVALSGVTPRGVITR
jgi:DNA-binding beta-propeller fold protein YncE